MNNIYLKCKSKEYNKHNVLWTELTCSNLDIVSDGPTTSDAIVDFEYQLWSYNVLGYLDTLIKDDYCESASDCVSNYQLDLPKEVVATLAKMFKKEKVDNIFLQIHG